MADIQVNYLSRDFADVRADLLSYLQTFFPTQYQDFNVASPGMAMLELNAYCVDLLSFVADKKFNELFLDGVQDRKSAYRLAKTKGYKIPGNRPAVTLIDVSVQVPVLGDGPDPSYTPLFRAGFQIKGSGQIFQTVNDIDFSNDFSVLGQPNRIITPVLDGNQNILYYIITKREIAQAGVTKIFKQEVVGSQAIPFYQLNLPENNVLSVTNVVIFNQLGITTVPSYQQFNDPTLQYYEVDFLPTDKIFTVNDSVAGQNGLQTGIYVEVPQRFEKEFFADGSCRLTFGGGTPNFDAYNAFLTQLTSQKCPPSNLNVSQLLQNDALGVMVPPNSTIFVKYVVGGGILSNVGSNTLQQVSNIDAVINGSNPSINQQVINSATANNPIAAVGGVGLPSVQEIVAHTAAVFATQDRCVTLDDYVAQAYQIPGQFGAPFRIQGDVQDNKVILYILTQNANGTLLSSSNSIIKNNLVSYLTPYRMINDYIEIDDGSVINIQVEVDLFINKNFNANEVSFNAIQAVSSFFDINSWQMGQTVYVSQLWDLLGAVPGVINVVDVRFYNMQSGPYSSVILSQATGNRTVDPNTGAYRTQIILLNNAIYVPQLAMIAIYNPSTDILIRTA